MCQNELQIYIYSNGMAVLMTEDEDRKHDPNNISKWQWNFGKKGYIKKD